MKSIKHYYLTAYSLIGKSIEYWSDQSASTASSSISFYIIFCLAPLLVTLTAVLGLVLGQSHAFATLIAQIQPYVHQSGLDFIVGVFQYQQEHQTSNILAVILATLITLLTSFSVMYQIKKSLEEFWDPAIPLREKRYKKPWKRFSEFVRERVASLILLPLLAIVFLASIALSTVSQIILQFFPFSGFENLFNNTSNVAILFILIMSLFALMYRYLPDYTMKWKSVFVGASVASVLFILGKLFVELYITYFLTTSQYGAASSLFALMTWIFYSTQVFFIGAATCLVIEKRTY